MLKKDTVAKLWSGTLEKQSVYFPINIDNNFFIRLLNSRWISYLLKDNSKIKFLEAGCGLGRYGISLAVADKQVTLMDCSEISLSRAGQLKEIAQEKLGKLLEVVLVKGSLENMKFNSGQFDITFNEGVVEHWLDYHDRIRVIKEMARVTKNGGYVAIRVPNNKNFVYNIIFSLILKNNTPNCHKYDLKGLKKDMADAGLNLTYWDGEGITDVKDWVKYKWLTKILNMVSKIINQMPKSIRQEICPTIFCIGIVS